MIKPTKKFEQEKDGIRRNVDVERRRRMESVGLYGAKWQHSLISNYAITQVRGKQSEQGEEDRN